jgi:hypothetical protein
MNIRSSLLFFPLLAALLTAPMAMGVAPTADELSAARQWAAARFQGREETPKAQPALPNEQRAPLTTDAPFSFNYNGRPSGELLKEWPCEQRSRESGPSQTEHTLNWTDPHTGLQVRCVAVEYHDFPTVEPYAFWSNVSPSLGFGIDMRVPEIDYAALCRD